MIDSLTALAVADGGDVNLWQATDVRRLIDGVRSSGAAVLLVHHTRKNDGTMRDSGDVAAAADVVIEFDAGRRSGTAPEPHETRRRLTYWGRLSLDTLWIDYDRDTGRYRMTDESAEVDGGGKVAGTNESRLDATVVDHLKAAGPAGVSVTGARTNLGRRESDVRASLKRVAVKGAAGRWRLPPGAPIPDPSTPSVGMNGMAPIPDTHPAPIPVDRMGRDGPHPVPHPIPSQHLDGMGDRDGSSRPIRSTHPGAVRDGSGTGDRPVCTTCRRRPSARGMNTCPPCVRMLRVWSELRGKDYINAAVLQEILGPEWTVKTAVG